MPAWIRVRDDATGAHYDVDERSLRSGMTRLDGYPVLSGPFARPRPAKYPTRKDGTPVAPAVDTSPTDPEPTQVPALPADDTRSDR